jgi:iron complex outermembrane receptor protein
MGGLVTFFSYTNPPPAVWATPGVFVAYCATAARNGGTAVDVGCGTGLWAPPGGGGPRRSGDVDTPLGEIANSQSRSGFGNIGAAWTGSRGFGGASYGYDDTKYGVPVVDEGQIELTPRRHTFSAKAGVSELGGFVEGIRADYASRRYRHDELFAGEADTRFRNDTDEVNLKVRHRQAGRFTGTLGAWLLNRNFAAIGDEALSPPVHERGAALFL